MTPWVIRLLVANIAVFVVTETVPGAFDALKLVPPQVPSRPWTPVTYMFVHVGFGHLFFNMLALYFFGPRLEIRLSSRHFVGLYFVAGLTGAVFSITTPVGIVGASGAVMGVLLAYAMLWPRDRIYLMGVVPIQAWLLIAIYVLADLSGAFRGGTGVAHLAHLGGFAGGFIYLKVLERLSAAARFRTRAAFAPPPARSGDVERWRRIDRDGLHPVNREELDRVLAKLEASGSTSLTADERAFLDRFSGA